MKETKRAQGGNSDALRMLAIYCTGLYDCDDKRLTCLTCQLHDNILRNPEVAQNSPVLAHSLKNDQFEQQPPLQKLGIPLKVSPVSCTEYVLSHHPVTI